MLNVHGSIAIKYSRLSEVNGYINENINATISKYDTGMMTNEGFRMNSKLIQLGTISIFEVLDIKPPKEFKPTVVASRTNINFLIALMRSDNDTISFFIHPANVTASVLNYKYSYSMLNKLKEEVNKEYGDDDLEKYNNFMLNRVLTLYLTKYSGNLMVDMFDMTSASVFYCSDKDMVFSILNAFNGEPLLENDPISQFINSSSSLSIGFGQRDSLGRNRLTSLISILSSHFEVMTNELNGSYYPELVLKCNDPDELLEDMVDAVGIREELENSINKPLEEFTKVDTILYFPGIYVINKINVDDAMLKRYILDTLMKKFDIPEWNVGYIDCDDSTILTMVSIQSLIKKYFGGILVLDINYSEPEENKPADMLGILEFNSFNPSDALSTIITSPNGKNVIPVILTDDVTRTVNFLENLKADYRVCINTIKGVDYFTADRLLKDVYDRSVDDTVRDIISKEDIKKMINIEDGVKYTQEDFFMYYNKASLEIAKKLYPKFEYKKSNESTYDGTEKLNELIGLDSIKKEIRKIIAFYKIMRYRQSTMYFMCPNVSMSYSMVFTGNPGTAKTTVAKILAEGLYQAKVINSRKFAFVTRGDIVDRFVGGTAKNVRDLFEKYRNGTIFLDEAYSLQIKDAGGYGEEAINEIVAKLDECRDTLVIFAGYPKEMETFINTNPGLKSRIGFYVNFKDYDVNELLQIIRKFAKDQGYVIEDQADETITSLINIYKGTKKFGNGRFMRKVFESAQLNQSLRLVTKYKNVINAIPVEDLKILKAEDFEDVDPYNVLEGTITNEDLRKQIL